MTSHVHTPATTSTGGAAFFDWLDRARARRERRAQDRAIARTQRALRSLSDDTLRDIGLTRSEIGDVAIHRRFSRDF